MQTVSITASNAVAAVHRWLARPNSLTKWTLRIPAEFLAQRPLRIEMLNVLALSLCGQGLAAQHSLAQTAFGIQTPAFLGFPTG